MLPQPIQIALADDSTAFRSLLGAYLARHGCSIICQAVNGKELLEQLASSETLPEICIIDIHMPVMDGFETVKALRLTYPQIRILGYSFFDADKKRRMLECGSDDCLDKVDPPEKLMEAILFLHQLQKS